MAPHVRFKALNIFGRSLRENSVKSPKSMYFENRNLVSELFILLFVT